MSINDNQRPAKQRVIKINGKEIPVTEEVYRAYKRPAWAEHKRKEREKRCRDAKGNRCTKDCSKCGKQRNGSVLSLDRFIEDGFDVADTVDIAELVADKVLLDQLVAALDELELDERALINALFFEERTERDYAAELGLKHQSVNKRKKKILEKLRALMGAKK